MTRGEIWKDFFKRTVLPAVIALFLFFMFKNVFTEDGQTNYFYVWLCCGINGFTQCHACVVQTTTRYAGVHKKLYKKITNRITIRMFKSIVKKKGDFNGK